MKKNILKKENIYMSKLLLKFINAFVFINLKRKIENKIYLSFFFWKKQLNSNAIFFFLESLLKLQPLFGFYVYIIKKKTQKKLKLRPFFMLLEKRWKKAVYWISRSIKATPRQHHNFSITISNEIYNISILNKGQALAQKSKHYKTILKLKTTKNHKW